MTYYSAVIATNGRYISRKNLIDIGNQEMKPLEKFFDNTKDVLEFGSGLGKNLICISDKMNTGYGLDINALFIRIAKKLSKYYCVDNVTFLSYDGKTFPQLPKVDVVIEKGVFERLPRNLVQYYVQSLRQKYLKNHGQMILYFLSERAKNSEFTMRLGDKAYVFWDKASVLKLLTTDLDLELIEVQEWQYADVYVVRG